MLKYYNIAKIIIGISNSIKLSDSWDKYLLGNLGYMIPKFTLYSTRCAEYIHQVEHITLPFYGKYVIQFDDSIIILEENWTAGQLIDCGTERSLYDLLLQLFYTHAVQRHFIQVHSSLISYHGKGIMFLGPSGIGKTTQAELWHQYRNADIINGDLVFVEHRKDEFIGWGTPWHGSSPYCENASVPVVAWVVLKQSNQNTIRRLSGFEMVSEVAQSIFYPLWLENGTELCMQTLDSLLKEIPVYELSCRPDEESVQLLYDELSRNNILDS